MRGEGVKLSELELVDFRSFSKKRVELSCGSTLFWGQNGAGKTNLLEAIWLLATGRSFRARREEEMIRKGREWARVAGKAGGEALEVMLTRGELLGEPAARKRYKINGVHKRRMDFLGQLRTVLFRPENLELILGSPAVRREYLDSVLEQVDEGYRRSLAAYQKGLRQRNRLLWRTREGQASPGQLLFWNQLLVKNGAVMQEAREELVEFINQAFGRERISQVFARLALVYDRSVISEARLAQYRRQEIAAGMTLVGPHRDDFAIENREQGAENREERRDLGVFGSRGEQRLAVLALKLAEISFVTQKIGERPLLLLDDIFSELDHGHRQDVLKVVGQQQTVMTTTDLHLVDKKYVREMKLIKL